MGQNFQKTIVIFEIITLKIGKFQNLLKKQKMLKFRSKKELFGYIWDKILKNYCHITSQDLKICQIGKSREKAKMPKLWTKNALFGYFWTIF